MCDRMEVEPDVPERAGAGAVLLHGRPRWLAACEDRGVVPPPGGRRAAPRGARYRTRAGLDVWPLHIEGKRATIALMHMFERRERHACVLLHVGKIIKIEVIKWCEGVRGPARNSTRAGAVDCSGLLVHC